MRLAADDIVVHLRKKCRFHLLRRTAESDHVPAGRDAFDLKSLALQPPRHLVDVTLAQPKAAAELLRREPALIIGRAALLLGGEQRIEVLLLRGSHFESDGHAQRQGRIDPSLIEFKAC